MASLQSKIGIWNAALDRLREQPLESTASTDPTALWLARNYDQKRDYLLERANWKFGVARATIAASSAAPAWGWSKSYKVPSTWLRVIPPTEDGSWMGTPIPYEIETDADGDVAILCNVTSPLRARGILRVTLEGRFSNGFCEVLGALLARDMAHWVTGKQSMRETLDKEYKELLADVTRTEAIQLADGMYYDTDIGDMRESYY